MHNGMIIILLTAVPMFDNPASEYFIRMLLLQLQSHISPTRGMLRFSVIK